MDYWKSVMTTKAKINNNSKSKRNSPNAEYRDRLAVLSQTNAAPDYIVNEVSQDLENWAENTPALRINDFLLQRKLSPNIFYGWLEKFPRLKEAYEFALMAIASRREVGAITRKYDSGSALKMMPQYDKDWANMMRFEADLKKQSQGDTAVTINVIEEPIPNSNLVPELKDKN
jgi:hypothetical protein